MIRQSEQRTAKKGRQRTRTRKPPKILNRNVANMAKNMRYGPNALFLLKLYDCVYMEIVLGNLKMYVGFDFYI